MVLSMCSGGRLFQGQVWKRNAQGGYDSLGIISYAIELIEPDFRIRVPPKNARVGFGLAPGTTAEAYLDIVTVAEFV